MARKRRRIKTNNIRTSNVTASERVIFDLLFKKYFYLNYFISLQTKYFLKTFFTKHLALREICFLSYPYKSVLVSISPLCAIICRQGLEVGPREKKQNRGIAQDEPTLPMS